jgi:2-amino-4-hydroxy-6-hydroxymethyldihydropteridine diphosphokinase
MVQAVIALGGNLGDVGQTFDRAMVRALEHPEVQSVQSAERFRSVAMGAEAGDAFVNSAWVVETTLEPLALLDLLQQIENELGRTRDVRWGPRTLDLDVIFYGKDVIELPRLVVPHPHCWYRQFVLAPVASLLPEFIHPIIGLTMRQLSERLVSKPFRLGIGGKPADDAAVRMVADEFSSVEVQPLGLPDDDLVAVSLAVWLGTCETPLRQPLWLQVSSEDAVEEVQFLRDALTAASTPVEAFGASRKATGQ